MSENEASKVNVPLLRKAVEWAEAEAAKPSDLCEWDQKWYVLPRSETDPNVDPLDPVIDNATWWRGLRQQKAPECGTCFCIAGFVAHSVSDLPVRYHFIQEVAAGALNLSDSDANLLFAAHNTISDVRRIAEDLAGERL